MENSLKNISLVVSQECNIACTYCYAKGGDYGKGKVAMSDAIMERALERLLPLTDGRCAVSFFGGEPLLNFDLMKQTVACGKRLAEKNGMDLSYSMTTNGTVLDEEIISFLKEYVACIVVSLDGDKQVNDTHRVLKNGRGGHDLIVRNLRRLKSAGVPFGINATVSPQTVHHLKETIDYLASLGAQSLRVVPVIPQGDQRWDSEGLRLLLEMLGDVNLSSMEMIFEGKEPVLAEHIYKVASNVVKQEKRTLPCSAGVEIVSVAANGDVYPCDYFVGLEDFRMGNVLDDSFPDGRFYDIGRMLFCNTVEEKERCRDCWARYICGGECHARSFMLQGSICAPSHDHCAVMKGVSGRLIPAMESGLMFEERREALFKFFGKPMSNGGKEDEKAE